ncbi:MAG: M20/M25/M40 family metallo-hydrolase, partial [Staphylococcus sp.]|nr:M20/M25/M40 family metallo-hydrolase [Staphylococcus sp.]
MTAQTTQPASLPWLEKLVAIPTVSGSSNLELIELLEAEFGRYGYSGVRTYNEDRTRANLFITVPAADGTTRGGLVLSGHTDVVPVAGQDWASDPFTLRVEGTRAYGRGVCDMKGFIAVALWLLPRVAEAKLRVPLHFAFSYDEEIGCVGAPSLIEEFVARDLAPDYAIVGEPSSMRIIDAHKGAHRGRVTFTGVPKHGSLATHGVNAVAAAGEFITFFTDMADQWEEEGPYDESF